MHDAANIDFQIRKGRQFSGNFQLATRVINADPVPRDVTGAAFSMQFRAVRGGAVLDLAPTYTEIDLSLGLFNFAANATTTDLMVSTGGVWEIRMIFEGATTTPFDGAYTVLLPVVP